MNPGTLNRPTLITAWSKPSTRAAVVQRIQTLTGEMEGIQAEIHKQLTGTVGKPSSFLEDATAVQALNHLKAELDQLQRILCFYLEDGTKRPLGGTNQEQQARPERADGTQQQLTLQPSSPLAGDAPAWFFDRLNLVIDSYLQEKKPAAAETKPISRRDAKAFS